MKHYKYKICNRANIGNEENPIWISSFFEKTIPATGRNEEIAKVEAYNGEYTIIDDGQPDIVNVADDVDNMLVDHEYRLTMLELGM